MTPSLKIKILSQKTKPKEPINQTIYTAWESEMLSLISTALQQQHANKKNQQSTHSVCTREREGYPISVQEQLYRPGKQCLLWVVLNLQICIWWLNSHF